MSSPKRLRVPLGNWQPGPVTLPADTARYVTRVHRLGEGQAFVVFDPETAREADAEIVAVSKREVRIRIGPARDAAHRAHRPIMVVQAIGKADKTDAVVRDATELGATHVVPVVSERSVARRTGNAALRRHQRIAVEASRQCGRGDVPRVEATTSLADACGDIIAPFLARPGARGFALHVDDGAGSAPGPLPELLRDVSAGAPVCFAVGPEGGFSPADLVVLREAGLVPTSLGPLVLRTETVCAAVLGAVLLCGTELARNVPEA